MVQLRNNSRGQVLILTGVVIALAVLASVAVLNAGRQADVDHSNGLSTIPSEAMDIREDVDQALQASIIRSNRHDQADFDKLTDQQVTNFTEVIEYSGHQADITINDKISGQRLYRDGDATLTNDTNSIDWTAIDNPSAMTGGIEVIPGSLPENPADSLTIDADTHIIEVINESENTTRAEVNIVGGGSSTYRSNDSVPYIDLGEGSFDGYRFEGYDQTDVNHIKIEDGDNAKGNIEFVLRPGYADYDGTLTQDTNAVFGVVYTTEIHADRQTLTTQGIATHGPLRGDF